MGQVVTGELLKGHAREAIIEEAKNWEADLIVVGSHGYQGFKRLWLGSVSQAEASHAPCSVEIVRSRHQSSSNDVSFVAEREVRYGNSGSAA
jgi:nucleotide-binding universal stress UspA family protein